MVFILNSERLNNYRGDDLINRDRQIQIFFPPETLRTEWISYLQVLSMSLLEFLRRTFLNLQAA